MIVVSQLRSALDGIRDKFFTIDEFPYIDRSRFPMGVCEAAMQVKEEDLDSYCASLSGKQLEAMIRDITELETEEERERITTILAKRFSPRLIKLIFSLYQVHYNSGGMEMIQEKLIKEASRRDRYPDEGLFFWAFGDTTDLFGAIKKEIFLHTKKIDFFFETYHIGLETRLSLDIRRHSLKDAAFTILTANTDHLIYLIERLPIEELNELIENYVRRSDIKNSLDPINYQILNKMGEPVQSEAWDGYPEDVKNMFSQWCFYHHLKLHSMLFPKKYEILSKYYENIEKSYELSDLSALVIEFPGIVVVDISIRPFSCFYYKDDFYREMKKWKEFDEKPAFLNASLDQISARDYIIEEKEDLCMLLRYEGIDLMYIEELLDIKIGLEPEFRRIKKQLV